MAFTGLGSGTLLDPYQITTIAQFKEMYLTWSSVSNYFKLMNDLDLKDEAYFAVETFTGSNDQLYFIAKLDGNNKVLQNCPTRGYALPFYQGKDIEIKDLTIRYNSYVSDVAYLFYSNNIQFTTYSVNATISNLKVVVEPGSSPVYSRGNFSATSSLTNLHFEGKFANTVIGTIAGTLDGITVNNLYDGVCDLCWPYANANIQNFKVFKPYTKIVQLSGTTKFRSLGFTVNTNATPNYMISNGFMYFGVIDFIPSTSLFYGRLILDNNISGGNMHDCYYVANCNYTNIVDDYLGDMSNCSNVHFFGNLYKSATRTSLFSYANGIFADCFYNKDLQEKNVDQTDRTGLTSLQFKSQASFTDWDFVSTWLMGTNYPVLQSANEETTPLDYGKQYIDVAITDLSISLTPKFNGYTDNYGFDVFKISDGSTILSVANYTGPYSFDPSIYGGIVVKSFITENATKKYCGGAFYIDYEQPAPPTITGSNPSVAFIQLTVPVDLGGGTFSGFIIEKKTDVADWAVIANGYQQTELFCIITERTYFRAYATTYEYGVSEVSAQITVTPVTGGISIGTQPYRIYVGSQEIMIK